MDDTLKGNYELESLDEVVGEIILPKDCRNNWCGLGDNMLLFRFQIYA